MTVVFNEGKPHLLTWLAKLNPLNVLKVVMFKNDIVPAVGDVLADYTIATFTGYADFLVDRDDLGVGVVVGDTAEMELDPPPSFVCTGGADQNCYGWLLVGTTNSVAIAGERFAEVRVMRNGASETLDPFKFKLKGF